MTHPLQAQLPELPLVLWKTPPGLELALEQEGLPFVVATQHRPLDLTRGRFVLHHGKRSAQGLARFALPEHVLIDLAEIERHLDRDVFGPIAENRSVLCEWTIGGVAVRERVARTDRATLRTAAMTRLRALIEAKGGVFARLAPAPFPYRSAFGFRVDLDERYPEDYWTFARNRLPLEHLITYFVCTNAYSAEPAVLADLAGRDAQTHGHHHFTARDRGWNRRNLERSLAILERAAIRPEGYAGPHGRWTKGLALALEDVGLAYSSEFAIGRDDEPFYPWIGDRFARTLQIPVHPICEGLFFDALAPGSEAKIERILIEHFRKVINARAGGGAPVFLYGHPERRLARLQALPRALAEAVAEHPLLWRVTMTEFAQWRRRRSRLRWSLVKKGDCELEVQFENLDRGDRAAIIIARGHAGHSAHVPIAGPFSVIRTDRLAFERPAPFAEAPEPARVSVPLGMKSLIRAALDWETHVPIADLPSRSPRDRLKRRLRKLHALNRGRSGRVE